MNTNNQHLKQNISNICKASKFCGICLDSKEKLWSLDTEFDVFVHEQIHKKLLKDMLDYIFNDVDHQILSSNYVCSKCTDKSIQSYLFIYQTKQVSQIIRKCVTELYSKTIDIHSQLGAISTDCENSCVVIVLEQDFEMCQIMDIGKMAEMIGQQSTKQDKTTQKIQTLENDTDYVFFEAVKEEKVIVEKIPSSFADIISDIDIEKQTQVIESPVKCPKFQVSKENFDYTTHIANAEVLNTGANYNDDYGIDFMLTVHNSLKDFPEQDDTNNGNKQIADAAKHKSAEDVPRTYKCKRCREILPSHKAWKKHAKICRKVKIESNKFFFNCKICNKPCISQRALNTHYKTHSKVRCKVCQFIVPAEDLTEHMKINHEDNTYLCKLCKFFSFNAEELKLHMGKYHSGSKCALCHKKVRETDLKLHKCRFNCLECFENVCIHYKYLASYRDQVLKNISKIKCVDCDYVCPRREAMLGHANREHLDHHPFTCAHCSQQFYSRTNLRHHLNEFHKEKHVCEYCDQEFTSLFTLNKHKEICKHIERHHKCDLCSSSFISLEELANHVKLRHEKECLNCNLCKRQFLSSTKLQEHVFRVHSGLQMKRKRIGLDCPICDVKYATKKQLLDHLSIHGPGSRFPCKDCKEVFDTLKKLQTHKRIHYDDVIQCVECKKVLTSTFFPHHMVYCKPGREEKLETYTCEICGKIYNSKLQLKLHHKTHMQKTPCPICLKPTKPVYMKNHIKYMHSKPKKVKQVKPKIKTKYIIKCGLCEHTVSRHSELEGHVNRFHLKIKPHQCEFCKKTFFSKERLKIHLITHTTNKSCFCSICNKKFENKVCLKLHMRRHTGDTPYACDICNERFRTSSIMNTHKVKKHSEKTVNCPMCESIFHLTREMRSHFKKVHWKQKDKKFDPRDVKELNPAFYHLFEDGRLPKVDGEELFISTKSNEKFS